MREEKEKGGGGRWVEGKKVGGFIEKIKVFVDRPINSSNS